MKWIQWLIDHAWTVIIIGGVLTQLFQAMFKPKGGPAVPADETPERTFEDPELAAQTRRIREEIQRKITQRNRGHPVNEPEQEAEDVPPYLRDFPAEPDEKPALVRSRESAERQAAILAEQEAWGEKLREAQRMKAAIQQRSAFTSAPLSAVSPATGFAPVRSLVRADLASPDALRRAFVLREVLGVPVALRD